LKQVTLAELKKDLSEHLHRAEQEPLLIMRHGRPAGVLLGFADDEDWLDYRVEHDPRFLKRVAAARTSLQEQPGTRWEDLA